MGNLNNTNNYYPRNDSYDEYLKREEYKKQRTRRLKDEENSAIIMVALLLLLCVCFFMATIFSSRIHRDSRMIHEESLAASSQIAEMSAAASRLDILLGTISIEGSETISTNSEPLEPITSEMIDEILEENHYSPDELSEVLYARGYTNSEVTSALSIYTINDTMVFYEQALLLLKDTEECEEMNDEEREEFLREHGFDGAYISYALEHYEE